MNYKKKIRIVTALSFIGMIGGYIIVNPIKFGICQSLYKYTDIRGINFGCFDKTIGAIGEPLFLTSISLSIIFTILLFTKEAVWNTWKKFGIWYIPLTALLIYITPTNTGGSWGFSMSIDREGVTMFLSALFVIISLSIIGIKLAKLKKVSTSSIVKVILSILVVLVVLSFL